MFRSPETDTTGEEIEEQLEEEDDVGFPFVVTVLGLVIVFLLGMIFSVNYWYPLIERRERQEKHLHGLIDSEEDEHDAK